MKKITTDIYGLLIKDTFINKGGFEIIERDDGFIESRDAWKAYFLDYKDWSDVEKKAIKFAKGKILDIGCGAGRHSLYLQRKGFMVTAVDNSPGSIEICKKQGIRNCLVLDIKDIDKLNKKYDTFLLFGNNLGLLEDFKIGFKILDNLKKIANHKAIIIASSVNPYLTKDPMHLNYHKKNIAKRLPAGRLRLRLKYKNFRGLWFNYLFVSPDELKNLAKSCGWEVKKIISCENDSHYCAILELE
jgi:2-polyprenyl-3-methyl-5-hydroxy-6-metoxy-1,4-benzoquinol methylase